MIVCGVELTGSDAVVCMLNMDRGQFNLPDCKVRKLSLPKNHSREDLKTFQATFAELMADSELNVTLVPPALVKSTLANNPVPIAFADTGLKAFQENAFITAYVAQLNGTNR